jgi:hypothetical protein
MSTKQIEIIESTEDLNINRLTDTDRQIIFERLSEEMPDVDLIHFQTFQEEFTRLLDMDTLYNVPTIPELLIKKILYFNEKYPLIIKPILKNFTDVSLLKKKRTTSYYKSGGKFVPIKKINLQKQVALSNKRDTSRIPKKSDGVVVNFDWIQPAVLENNTVYYIPTGESNQILGIVFEDFCSIKPDVKNKMLSSKFNYTDLAYGCDSRIKGPVYNKQNKRILFRSKDDVVPNVLELINYILRILKIINSGDIELYVYFQYVKIPMPISNPIKTEYHINLQKIESNIVPLINNISELYKIKIPPFVEHVASDLYANKIYNIYVTAQLNGRDDKKILNFLSSVDEKNKLLQFQNSLRKKYAEVFLKISILRSIVEKKFGNKRYIELYGNQTPLTELHLYTPLNPNERKIINIEYNQQREYAKAVLENKCPHVILYKKFRTSTNNRDIRNYLQQLEKFFMKDQSKKNTESYIKCNNCGFDLICPHLVTLTRLTIQNKTFREIKEKLSPYVMYAPSEKLNLDNYFCKICSEMINSVDIYDEVMSAETADMHHSIDDDLKKHIWSEMSSLLQYIKILILINPSKLINAMMAACYEFIFEIEKQLIRSKTNTTDDIKRKRKLFIGIYGYAYLIQLVAANLNNPPLIFKGMKGTSNTVIDYLKFAIINISNTYNVTINQLSGVSADFIKTKILEAYKAVGTKGAQTIYYSDKSEDFYSVLILDPLYKYIYKIISVDKNHHSRDAFDFVKNIHKYLGKNIDQLAKSKESIYDEAPFVKTSDLPELKSYNRQSAKELFNIWEKYRINMIKLSYNQQIKMLHDKVYTKYWYSDNVLTPEVDKYISDVFELKQKEYILYLYKTAWNYPPLYNFKPDKNDAFEHSDIGLKWKYDEKGQGHRWNIYVTKDNKEYNQKDISEMLNKGDKFDKHIVDRKCSICGIFESQVRELNNDKIKKAIDKINMIINFMRMYENRCPVGGVHIWINNVCKKCGLNLNERYKYDSKGAIEYYEKYKSHYNDDLQKLRLTLDTYVSMAKKISYDYPELNNYTFNYKAILDLCSKTKNNQNAFLAIGASENVLYDNIISGEYIPPEPEEKHSQRLYIINGYIYRLIREYNNIRHISKMDVIIDLQDIVNNSGIKKHEYDKLKTLPSIYDNYGEKLQWMIENKPPKRLIEFAIESLAIKLNNIYMGLKPDGKQINNPEFTKKMREHFVLYFIKSILRKEELTTRANINEWALFKKQQKSDEIMTTIYNSNYDYENGLEIEKDLEKDKKENDDYGATNELFSMDAFDIDINEDDPDDMGDNDIGTEGYGLD